MMKEIDYSDQARSSVTFYDRRIDSSYTEHGIHCIDAQYCHRIRNIHNRIAKIINIPIERMLTKGDTYLKEAQNLKAEISIDDFINKRWGGWGNELRITWEDGTTHEFFYWDKVIIIDPETGREDPKSLEKDIKTNPHLHQDIKNNLLENLFNILE